MAQAFELDGLRLLGKHHLMIIGYIVLRIGELTFRITQDSHPSPTAPLLEGFMDIGDTLCHRQVIHPFIAGDGQFTTFLQFTVFRNQGIQLFYLGIAFQLSCHQTGSHTVTRALVIVVERCQIIQLIAYDTQ